MKINIAGNKVIVKQGTLFQFQPALEIHEFINDSDKPFYFLGFDYWNESMHEYFKLYHDIKSIINNPVRTSGYGAAGTEFKYMSKH